MMCDVNGLESDRDTFNYAADVFDKVAEDERYKDKTAVWFVWDDGTERKVTYSELKRLSHKFAHVLRDTCGVSRGDVVMVSVTRCPEWWIAMLALIRLGAVYVPSFVQSTEYERLYQVQYSECSAIITCDHVIHIVDKIQSQCPKLKRKIVIRSGADNFGTTPASTQGDWLDFHAALTSAGVDGECEEIQRVETRWEDVMAMYFTSGTTDRQKLVVHTVASLRHPVDQAISEFIGYDDSDVFWQLTDTAWVKCTYASFLAPFKVAATVFMHEMKALNFATCFDVFAKYPVTLFCAPPTCYRFLVKQLQGGSSGREQYKRPQHLKRCYSGGETLNPEVSILWQKYAPFIRECYGQSELGFAVCHRLKDPPKPGSMGKALKGYRGVILDDNMERELPDGEEGILAFNMKPTPPKGLFKGYKNDAKRTASLIHNDYFISGDRALRDSDGSFFYRGRSDDIIITYLGIRIGPGEIEDVLVKHEAVIESAVVSTPDDNIREAIKAFVVLTESCRQRIGRGGSASSSSDQQQEDALISQLKEHIRSVLGDSRVPHQMEFVPSLPRTSSGKLRRVVLRQQEWANVTKGSDVAASNMNGS